MMAAQSSWCWAVCAAAVLVLTCAPARVYAQASPAGKGNADVGKTLHDKDCVACHARQFNGDASKIYTRPDHRVRTPAQLRAQIAYCNTQLGTQYFPEDEENVFAYLNRDYYRFKP
jgi:hypothetical protein